MKKKIDRLFIVYKRRPNKWTNYMTIKLPPQIMEVSKFQWCKNGLNITTHRFYLFLLTFFFNYLFIPVKGSLESLSDAHITISILRD